MNTPINDGGPAFPEHHYFDPGRGQYGQHMTASDVGCGGMSLRDWFAGQALAGKCAFPADSGIVADKLVAEAYIIADAMIAARNNN